LTFVKNLPPLPMYLASQDKGRLVYGGNYLNPDLEFTVRFLHSHARNSKLALVHEGGGDRVKLAANIERGEPAWLKQKKTRPYRAQLLSFGQQSALARHF
jgi:hypothetical protein